MATMEVGIPPSGVREKGGLDLGGVALPGLALLTILFPLIEGREFGWRPAGGARGSRSARRSSAPA
ncbi:MAG: hypothetical protein RIB84_17460 [Sneathiellaceae bacterium]